MVRGLYVEADAPLFIRDVSCNGSESAFLDCPYNMLTQTSCGPFSDAGIVCQGETTVHTKFSEPRSTSSLLFTADGTSVGSCSDGELRLGNGTDDYDEWTRRGRVELCINNAWGTVCDTSFSVPDALVACNQLVGFQREGQCVCCLGITSCSQ